MAVYAAVDAVTGQSVFDSGTPAELAARHPDMVATVKDTSPWPTLSIPGGPITTIDTVTGEATWPTITFPTLDFTLPTWATTTLPPLTLPQIGPLPGGWQTWATLAGIGALTLFVASRPSGRRKRR